MKKFYKISGAILFIGIILLFIGKVNNGDRGYNFFNIGSFHSDKRHDDDNDYDNDDYDDHDDDDYDERTRSSQAAEINNVKVTKFNRIKLDTYEPDVQISLGKKFQVKVTGPKHRKINAWVKDQELTLADHEKHSFTSFMGRNGAYTVEIIVPNRNAIKELTGNCSDSDLFLKGVIIPRIDLKLKEGDMTMNKIKVKNAKLHLDEGDIKVTNSTLASGNFTLNEGDLILTNSQFKMKATLNDGYVSITNPDLRGSSMFNLTDGDFKMVNAPKLDYDLSTDRESDIRFQGSYRTNHFVKRTGKLPVLKVASADGDIIID